MVAALENRGRKISAGDLVALSVAFGLSPGALVPEGPGRVWLEDGTGLPLESVRLVLEAKLLQVEELLGPLPPVLAAGGDLRETPARAGPSAADVELAARSELERNIARALGVDPLVVASTAYRLWGRPATQERDRRAPDPDRPGLKRQVSRAIRLEIEAELEKSRARE